MRSRPAVVLALASLVVAGCPAGAPTLTVRVQSGLRAGHEVRRVDVALFPGSARCDGPSAIAQRRELGVGDQRSLGAGTLTVAEYPGLATGVHALLVTAYRPEGAGLAELLTRCLVVSLVNDRVVRVPLTTDCLALTCPLPGGSPSFTECLGGRCVDPRCELDDPSTAEHCCDRAILGDACDARTVRCTSTTECDELLVCAGAARCIDGVCVEGEEDDCDPGEYCSATSRSCEPEPDAPDGGVGPPDAGMFDAGAVDAPALDAFAGSCPGECAAGAMDTRGCGSRCGRETRTCGSDCRWGAWSTCGGEGACSPGDEDSDACGNCDLGTRTRSCGDDCSWGGWSGCGGGGACSPGEVDTEACACGGTQSRTCSGSCSWGGWSACSARQCTDVFGGNACPGETGTGTCRTMPACYQRCTCSSTGTWVSCTGSCFC